MRCTAYCTADSYSLPRLIAYLKESNRNPTLYKDVTHVLYPREGGGNAGDIFYFPYGAVIFFGFSEEEEISLLNNLKDFEIQPLAVRECDELSYLYGTPFKIHQDDITLPDSSPLVKLALAYGTAQSVKLTTFENTIRETIQKTRPLPENLYKKGKIFLSRKEISRKIGELFIERNSINLHSDILDTPEFFWEYPEVELYYRTVVNYLDLAPRVEVLNKRLDIVRELLEMLGNELNHQHSSALEWTIICLIVIEVFIALLRDLLHAI